MPILSRPAWWKEAVVYQIYPRSFMDGNGDGIGDLVGVIGKLDYLKWLGVDVLWLSPIYKSPNDDNGYDISDYQQIMAEFGTMDDFDQLLAEAHGRGIRVILDLVVNHTSDEHPWFVESRSSKTNPKRDWYIWREQKNGAEPNNWGSYFSGSAWQFDEHTGQYFLHLFSKKQPDLNWENPQVREAVYEMMRWWLDKGVDGFRMDVINFLKKAPGLPDADLPPNYNGGFINPAGRCLNQPGMKELLQEMNREVLSKYDILTVGEIHDINPQTGLVYVDEKEKCLGMTFQFDIVYCRNDFLRFKRTINNWYTGFKGRAWNTFTLGNHDTPRMVNMFGNAGSHRAQSAKVLATLLLTAPGTPFFLQGDEIGMSNVSFPEITDYRDIEMLNRYRERLAKGELSEAILNDLRPYCRDNARTPMQWNTDINAGFSSGRPWICANPNYQAINVENQLDDPHSIANYYRRLIALRKASPDLIYSTYEPLCDDHPHLHAYIRCRGMTTYLIVLNFWTSAENFELPPHLCAARLSLLLSTNVTTLTNESSTLQLCPWEARIYSIQ